MSSIYLHKPNNFINHIILQKRKEMLDIINEYYENKDLHDALDIGSTNDVKNEHSNYLIKNLKKIKVFKSISDQKINSDFFTNCLTKSILEKFTSDEINQYKSDLVLSNATIEHVGSYENQLQMISNIIKLSKKNFVLITPNRYHPIDFHTQIPFIHWLPKKLYRGILNLIGFSFFAQEKNLNLLSEYDFRLIMKKLNQIDYNIKNIKFFLIKSNLILIGKKN